MRTPTWTIEVTERDLDVLGRNREAMVTLVREREFTPELIEDLHQCIDTLGTILGRVRPGGSPRREADDGTRTHDLLHGKSP